jgi:hypothetical protein
MLAQGFLDVRGANPSDALINRKCVPQWRGGLAWVSVLQVGPADPF